MRTHWPTTVSLIALVMAFVLCSRDYNPFTDPNNARAHVLSWIFAGKKDVLKDTRDSVPLYSTGRLKVVVAAREEVDSFVVTAKKSRFWPDTAIRRTFSSVPLDGGPYYFDVSFYDTGTQIVSVKTYRSNGDMIPQEFPVRVYNPLHQDTINGFFGIATLLATPPVTDKDVFYQWDFGEGRVEKWPTDTHSVVFPYNVFFSGRGSLQVTDLTGMHGTPLCSFSYFFTDTSAPVILCVNDSMTGDTLKVADSLLAFKVYIADRGMGNTTVDSCSINGDTFDFVNNKTHVYIKVYKNLPALTAGNIPLRIVVVAIDNLQFNNKAQDTFWVVYDPAGIKSPDANIRIISPTQDPSYSALRTGRIVGTAENYRGEGMVMSILVNDSLYPETQAISGGTGSWQWPVHLDSIINIITVQAHSSVDNRLLTYKQITVMYNPAVVDTIKPMIYEIVTPDGTPAGNAHMTQASTVLKIVAFDEGTGINSLTVNGATAAQDTNGYWWYCNSGTLVHSGQGNRFSIEAQDRAGNRTDTAIVIFRNSLPELVADPSIPAELCNDSGYMFHLATYDADNDSVTIVKVSAPPAMSISQNGTVFWKPTAADVGRLDSLVIQLSDQYEMTPRYCWKFTCRDCYQPLVPVRFATQEKDFPAFLQAGRDTLDIRLAIDTTRFPPYTPRYSARFIDNGNYILNNDTSGVLLWAPGAADTGYRRFMVIVGDGARGFDTLRPAVRVVPRNQYPCSLSYTFSGTLTPGGELDLFSHPAPETLFFAIHDLDNILTEEYTVTIVRNNVSSVEQTRQKAFFVVIRPDSLRVLDTLAVSVVDRTGTRDSVSLIVKYRSLPPPRRLYLNTTASGANVATGVRNFPVLVRLTNNNFSFSDAQRNGYNIRFRKSDNTPMPFEIERWDSAAARADIWVRVDTVYGNNNSQYFVLYWADVPAVDSSNSAAVFDTSYGFRGGWHLNEDPTTGGAIIRDYTKLGNNGTFYGTMSSANLVQGIAGNAMNFDGISDYVDFGNITVIDGVTKLTASAWFKPAALVEAASIFSKRISNNDGWEIAENGASLSGADDFLIIARNAGSAITQDGSTTNNCLSTGSWRYGVLVFDGTQTGNNNRLKFYLDGMEQTLTYRGVIPATFPSTAGHVQIAKNYYETNYFKGAIDEPIVANTARPADWIRLCYMNQKPIDALVEFR